MKKSIAAFLFVAISVFTANAQNPLLLQDNSPIPFDRIAPDHIRRGASTVMTTAKQRVEKLIQLDEGEISKQSLLVAYDVLKTDLAEFNGRLRLLSSVSTNEKIRHLSDSVIQALDKFNNENILLNPSLYKTFKKAGSLMSDLNDQERRFYQRIISDFEHTGVNLPADKQQNLKGLQAAVLKWSLEFDRNIAEFKDSVVANEQMMKGVPDALHKRTARPNGRYVLDLSRTTMQDVLTYASDASFRNVFWTKYFNLAYPKNIPVLDSLFFYRDAIAKLMNYKSFSDYRIYNKMAKDPQAVWAFENDLANKLSGPLKAELETLAALKKQSTGDASQLEPWDISYFNNVLLGKQYAVNTTEVNEYFELGNVLKGIFAIYQKLYGIQIKESGQYPVWSEKVKAYEVFKNQKKIGIFYMDLYPRPNKFNHFRCLGVRMRKTYQGDEVLPIAALICNFAEPTPDAPSLLSIRAVETAFHEFGHLIHVMFMNTKLTSQSWNSTGDFIEAPSQIMENWVWNYDALQLFAKHYKTGKVIPRELFEKLSHSRYVGSAFSNMIQLLIGMMDLTLHDKYDSVRQIPLVDIYHSLKAKLGLPDHIDDHQLTRITHFSNYASNYYGYLWSRVYAKDMYTVFEKMGPLSVDAGQRYRENILEPGISRDEYVSIEKFLGRKPNSDAFLISLGLKP